MRKKILFIVAVALAIFLNAFFIYYQEQPVLDVQSTLIDGIFVWSVNRFLIIGLFPMIIYSYFIRCLQDKTNINVVIRRKNRFAVWRKEAEKLFNLTLISFFIDVGLSFISCDILNGTNMKYSMLEGDKFYKNSYLGLTCLLGLKIDYCPKLNFLNVVTFIFINVLQLYLVLIVANGIRWLISPTVSYVVLYGVCGLFGVNHAAKYYGIDRMGIKTFGQDYYYEILKPDVFLQKIFIELIIFLLVTLIVKIYINRKNFLET